MVKTLFRVLINTLIGAVLIYFWFRLVDVNEILHALESFNPLILLPAVGFIILSSILKAIRFKVLLSKEIKIPALRIINLTFLSQLLSFTVPIRLGEIAKGVYLSTEYGLHIGRAVVWVFLDRFLDFWAILGLALIFLLFIPTNLPANVTLILFIGVFIGSIIAVLIVLKPEIFKKVVKLLSHLLVIAFLKEKFLGISYFLIDCFSLLKGSSKRNLGLLILTTLASLMEGLSWFVVLSEFLPGLPVFKVWLGSMLNSLTFLIPAAPGYVGSAEAAGLAVFTYGLGFDKTFVSASTIINHALNLLFILSSGIIGLYALKFNLGLVWKKLLKKD